MKGIKDNYLIMYRLIFFIIAITTVSLTSCNRKSATKVIVEEHIQQTDYVINENLSSSDYSDIDGYFPEEGFISTAEIATRIAETVLSNIYGKEHIEEEKPFSVNLEGDVWIIEGSLYYRKGGVAYIEIRKSDGKILKVIHTK
jgi:hypothetical protein